jgi:hypothetical protein
MGNGLPIPIFNESIDISDLPHGIYLTRILYKNQQLGIDRFIK